jgi:hypothetical protein
MYNVMPWKEERTANKQREHKRAQKTEEIEASYIARAYTS